MPKVRWFANQREALGLEAAVYAFMAVGYTLTLTLSTIMHVGTGIPELTIDQQTNQKVPKVPPTTTSGRHT